LTCVDAKDGAKLWSQELEFECHASPAISGNRLYQFGQDGSVVIAEVAREYKELFRTKLPDSFHASPAFVANTMVVRGMTNLWRFGQSATPIAAAGK
jgi:outer membrane protein assembly factor BamB